MLFPNYLALIFCFVKSWAIRPNIVFIVADDLGWNDVSFHGSKQIPTPNIDTLARDGIILNNYYVMHLCTPSRGSLMTGKHPIRIGLQHRVIIADEPFGLPAHEKILPQYLKELGYVTHGVGKWHLGFFEREYLPTNRGFDSYFGHWTGGEDYYTHVHKIYGRDVSGYDLHDDENIAGYHYVGRYSTELFTEKVQHKIRNHNYEQPLFLYLAHQAVHTGNDFDPLQVPPKYIDPFHYIDDVDRRKFAGVVSALDFSVGKILATLDEVKVLDNTIIVFTTDNGGAVVGERNATGSNYPLRGAKNTLWEGGTRGVACIWSQELRKASRVQDGLMHISDWLPTLYAAVGGTVAALKDLDGHNQWPSISRGEPSPRQEFLYNIDPIGKFSAIRKNQYKLIIGTPDSNYDGWFDRNGKNISEAEIMQYFTSDGVEKNIYTDISLKMENSEVWKVLAKNYGDGIFWKNFTQETKKCVVDCQLPQQNILTPCRPAEKPCLFDIEQDPCEFNNLANHMPQIVEELKILLLSYQQKSIPPENKPSDPLSNPKYHNNCFVPWRSKP